MIGGLYRGTGPNIARNCIINVGETVVYDAVKDSLLSSGRMSDGIPLHFTSAVVAGVTATFVASPVDVIKTRSGLSFLPSFFHNFPQFLNQVHEQSQRQVQRSSPLRWSDSKTGGTHGLLQRI